MREGGGGGYGPSGRFFFGRRHDVFLYHLVLESHVWDEARDDLVLDWRGNIVMRGGWDGVAAGMAAEFGVPFSGDQCARRMKLLESKDEYLNSVFEESIDLRDARELVAERSRLLGLLGSLVPEGFRPADSSVSLQLGDGRL